VAAVLAPLREVADEVVIAADARVGEDDLVAYAGVADRVLRIEFDFVERHLAWLHAQCSGKWALRLDDDEVVSPELLLALPKLVAAPDVLQYRIPRRWLYPDPDHWLAETPWSPDLQTRLVRTGALLRFPGALHTSAQPVMPSRVLEEPIYHLAHLLEDVATRRGRAIRYEVRRPGLPAPGGGPSNSVYYVPEDWARGDPVEVPVTHRAAIARVLQGSDAAGRISEVAVTSLDENDRFWAGRPLAGRDYAAELTLAQDEHRFSAGEAAEVIVRVLNLGTVTWPWGLEQPPLIRPAHRWLDIDGVPLGPDHPRSAFPCAVAPTRAALVPLQVSAPSAPGEYLLEVELVHEGVRWFGWPLRIPCSVVGHEDPPAVPAPPRRHGLRRPGAVTRIPPVVHRVWLGDDSMPVEQEAFGRTWARLNPGWEVRLWTDSDVPGLLSDPASFARARSHSERSDVLRYEILKQFGGVYADTDVECLRPLAPLIGDAGAFAGYEAPGRLGTALLGATAGHPLMIRAVEMIRHTVGLGVHPASTGPVFFTAVARDFPDLVRFAREVFYPYGYDEPSRRHDRFPDAYAVHHWAQSWARRPGSPGNGV
jgi:hypothetical protein